MVIHSPFQYSILSLSLFKGVGLTFMIDVKDIVAMQMELEWMDLLGFNGLAIVFGFIDF